VLNKVHGNGVLWAFQDWELLEESVGLVTGCFRAFADGTGIAEFLHKGSKVGPNIFLSDYCEGFVLFSVSGGDVIMFVLENLEAEVVHVWDINLIVMVE
jgi:hypothetical protein